MPNIDDGAKDIDESIEIIKMLQNQGVTDIIATPHFYPASHNLPIFLKKRKLAFEALSEKIKNAPLPKLHIGCEIMYFENMGNSDAIKELTLSSSNYILLELYNGCINPTFFKDLEFLKYRLGIIPIIAHIERYYNFKNYKSLLSFVEQEEIPTQINASSLSLCNYKRAALKLMKHDLVNFIGSDAHSVKSRPPKFDSAKEVITQKFGKNYWENLIDNSKVIIDTEKPNI